jgi:chromosomal replication initiation ATPase DnaA
MTGAVQQDGARDLFGERVSVLAKVRQLPLPLVWHGEGGGAPAGFVTGTSNADAVRHILRFAEWTSPATLLIGPAGSGRSTLLALFLAQHEGGAVVDGLIGADEEALFHAWNRAQADGNKILIIINKLSDVATVRLPDLATRLATAPVVTIGAPDDCLMRDLIEHLLVRRGLNPAPQTAAYVAARIERSYAAIHAAVAAIDAQALASGNGVGIRSARTALIAAGLYGGDAEDSDSPELM